MNPLAYVALIRQEGPQDFIVTFPDVPEAITQGDTLAEARANADDALEAALEGYIELGRDFPARAEIGPEAVADGVHWADVPVAPALAARALLLRAMKAEGLTRVAVAERMGRDEKTVRRILAGQNASLDLTLQALRAVGVQPALAA